MLYLCLLWIDVVFKCSYVRTLSTMDSVNVIHEENEVVNDQGDDEEDEEVGANLHQSLHLPRLCDTTCLQQIAINGTVVANITAHEVHVHCNAMIHDIAYHHSGNYD